MSWRASGRVSGGSGADDGTFDRLTVYAIAVICYFIAMVTHESSVIGGGGMLTLISAAPVVVYSHCSEENSMNQRWSRRRLLAASALGLALPAVLCAQQPGRAPITDAARVGQDSMLAQRERAQWEALKTRDTTVFARLMGGDVVDVDLSGVRRTSPASTTRYVLGCQTASYALSDLRVVHVDGTAIVTYKTTLDANCWGQKAPSPLYVMTVYQQRGETWLPIAHSETPAAR